MDLELLKACATIRRSGQTVDVILSLLQEGNFAPDDAWKIHLTAERAYRKSYKERQKAWVKSPAATSERPRLHTWFDIGEDMFRTSCELKTLATRSWLERHIAPVPKHPRHRCPRCTDIKEDVVRNRDLRGQDLEIDPDES